MNEPPRAAYHLANVLFSDADQKRLILYMSSKYDEAQIPDECCSSRVIYGDPLSVPRALPDEVAAVKKKTGGAVTFGESRRCSQQTSGLLHAPPRLCVSSFFSLTEAFS